MADGDSTARNWRIRPATPPSDGPLAASGAGPDGGLAGPPARAPQPDPAPEPDPVKRNPVVKAESTANTESTPPAEPVTEPERADQPAPAATSKGATDPTVTHPPPKTTAEPTAATSLESADTAGPEVTAAGPEVTAAGPEAAAAGPEVTAAGPEATAADALTNTTTPGSGDRQRGRLPRPREAATSTVRAISEWSRRPSGRLALPALLLLVLVAATGAAGAFIVPATSPAERPHAAADSDPDTASGLPTTAQPAPTSTDIPVTPPTGTPTSTPTLQPGTGGRPADVLAGWAQQTSARLEVPAVAVQAYGYAEMVVARTTPNCRLTWTTLAAIGQVESNHGRANGATLAPDGRALPEIIGLPLDGQGGRQRIADTDAGQLDRDRIYDRAVGPMQFIPSTWQQNGVDADNDGVKDPHDIDDAALAAANYLCKGGRNLSTPTDWWAAILSYNDVQRYAQAVFDTANRYGIASRT